MTASWECARAVEADARVVAGPAGMAAVAECRRAGLRGCEACAGGVRPRSRWRRRRCSVVGRDEGGGGGGAAVRVGGGAVAA